MLQRGKQLERSERSELELLTRMTFMGWKSFSLGARSAQELGQLRHALAKTESLAKVMLKDAAEELQSNSTHLLCLLILRLWRWLPAMLAERCSRLQTVRDPNFVHSNLGSFWMM